MLFFRERERERERESRFFFIFNIRGVAFTEKPAAQVTKFICKRKLIFLAKC